MSTHSRFKVDESSRGLERSDPIDYLAIRERQDLAGKIGVKYKRKADARLHNELKNALHE
jgi:hypothetical protein